MRSCLIDSGPLIALFAVDDHHHARFDALVKELSAGGLRLITTWPCIVEASYLLEIPQRFEMLKWIELGGAVVYPFEPAQLGDIVRWMRRFSERGKREMDLADAPNNAPTKGCGCRRTILEPLASHPRTAMCPSFPG